MSDASKSSSPDSLEAAAESAAKDAAALAEELGHQVGTDDPAPEPPTPSDHPSKPVDAHTADESTANAGSADDTANATADQADDPPAPTKSVIQLPSKKQRKAASDSGPTDSADQTSAVDPPGGSAADAKPTDVTSGDDLADAARDVALEAEGVAAKLKSKDAGSAPGGEPSADGGAGDAAAQVSPPMDTGWQGVAFAAADMLCRALDVIDKPFGRVGYRVRGLLGWLALAFLVASASLILAMAVL